MHVEILNKKLFSLNSSFSTVLTAGLERHNIGCQVSRIARTSRDFGWGMYSVSECECVCVCVCVCVCARAPLF